MALKRRQNRLCTSFSICITKSWKGFLLFCHLLFLWRQKGFQTGLGKKVFRIHQSLKAAIPFTFNILLHRIGMIIYQPGTSWYLPKVHLYGKKDRCINKLQLKKLLGIARRFFSHLQDLFKMFLDLFIWPLYAPKILPRILICIFIYRFIDSIK